MVKTMEMTIIVVCDPRYGEALGVSIAGDLAKRIMASSINDLSLKQFTKHWDLLKRRTLSTISYSLHWLKERAFAVQISGRIARPAYLRITSGIPDSCARECFST
tara:strand:- start:986 stop:1300 length:315 start_codon:yes stop_codon:yes gene_type:complete